MMVSAIQAVLASIAYFLLFISAQKVFGRGIALITLAAAALHPLLMFYDTSFEDSTLALFLLSATVFSALWARDGRALRWLLPGTAAGLMILARPSLFLVLLGVAGLIVSWAAGSRMKALAAFLTPVACLLAPVVWHNHAASGRWVAVTDTAGQNLYWGNNPFPDYQVSIQGYWNILQVDRGIPADFLTQSLKARTGQSSPDPAFMAEAMGFLKAHPGKAIAGVFHKAWRHLSNYEIPRNNNFANLREHVLLWRLPFLPFSILLLLAILGSLGMDKRKAWLFLLPWLAALFSEVVFFNASRYRALCVPFLLPFAIRALQMAGAAVKRRSWRGLATGAAAVVLATVLGETAVSSGERTRYLAADHFKDAMLESYAAEDGSWRRFSEENFRRSLELARRMDPDNLDAFVIEQKLLLDEGKNSQALAAIDAREARCRPGEWLCQDICGDLRGMLGQ
jgi:4-amino-4-deoxy-L-arabinose transferase-like glycosyltransferase